ncbi:hypothetical protein MANES_05G098250v8 [Manihot esculenta]|uniref:Uncharacterized protein n=1 Tax=Manihot esculenta TaxID=3983 RepID=A0ACB7HQ49_MANES|nr:hypothetical protein MANES_05G098250v8 [Manihot esculenta]
MPRTQSNFAIIRLSHEKIENQKRVSSLKLDKPRMANTHYIFSNRIAKAQRRKRQRVQISGERAGKTSNSINFASGHCASFLFVLKIIQVI